VKKTGKKRHKEKDFSSPNEPAKHEHEDNYANKSLV